MWRTDRQMVKRRANAGNENCWRTQRGTKNSERGHGDHEVDNKGSVFFFVEWWAW